MQTRNANLAERFRNFFTTRDFIFHDGRDLKRFSLAGRTQVFLAGVAGVTIVFSAYGVAQATVGAITLSGVAGPSSSPQAQMDRMRAKVTQMQADIAAAKEAAKAQAARVEQRQALISAMLSGKEAPADLRDPAAQALPVSDTRTSAVVNEVLAPLRQVESRQLALAAKARAAGEARYAAATQRLRSMGLDPKRFVGGVGGPFEPVSSADAATAASDADAQFRALFLTWKKLDVLEQTAISIPSLQPVAHVTFSSTFGVRSDPFRGSAAMHPGVDIPGAMGTPVYATADGIVDRAGRAGGYGNLVEINHGKGIETRYGHLSKILVADNTRVRRGQMIGLMGSTGRSTGPHLHYEVRVDGRAVNPVPFIQAGGNMIPVATDTGAALDGVGGE